MLTLSYYECRLFISATSSGILDKLEISEEAMVDSILGNSPSIQDSGLLNVDRNQSSQNVEKVNVESAQESRGGATLQLVDHATISDAAKKAYESEKEVMRFGRLAQRLPEAYNADKVSQMKEMFSSSAGIQAYLGTIDTDALAQNLLDSNSSFKNLGLANG
jgi:hypothetical protein